MSDDTPSAMPLTEALRIFRAAHAGDPLPTSDLLRVNEAAAVIAVAYIGQPAPGGAMLVWEDAPDHPGELRAFTPFGGLYTIRGGKAWFDGEGTHLRIGGAGHEFPDLPAARAACEADYAARMRAAGWVPAGEVQRALAAFAGPLAALPPGPWETWTSNSFRRITGPNGRDGGVLHAYRQRSDGHPDLSWSEAQCEAICAIVNGLRALATPPAQ